MSIKANFLSNIKIYKDALEYYGYSANSNHSNYPSIELKNSNTLSKQASLPRLPVPQLQSSINKYLEAIRFFLNETEFENTKKAVLEFIKVGGVGQKLQKLLIEKSKTTENWLAQWYIDKIYLEQRYNLLINSNPGTLCPRADYKTLNEQLMFATKYICGFLDFKNFVETQQFLVEKAGDSYICMDQYFKFFGTCRIPNKEKDSIKIMQACSFDLNKTNHITVLHNNRIFSLQLIDPTTGLSFSPSKIYNNLKRLVQISSEECKIGLGLLTGENRDIWADCYAKLCQNENNKQNFESIHYSLFVLCLDTKDCKPDDSIDVISNVCGQILHGNKVFTSNRWFDKILQVIISTNGFWGVNLEHTIADGICHTVTFDYIYKYITEQKFDFNSEQNPIDNCIRELNFVIPIDIQNQIEKSRQTIFSQIDDVDLCVLYFEAFGKNFPKSQKISPDAFIQIAIQLAYYRAHQSLSNTYEIASLRKFHLGRTELIRVCTSEVIEFIKAMVNENTNVSNSNKINLFLKAINRHRLNSIDAINFKLFERHLLGLELIALENGIELPDFFKDIGYEKLDYSHIASSQASSKYDIATFYGTEVYDGYGICYNICETKIIFGMSKFKSCQTTNLKMLVQHIENALLDCQNLLLEFKSKL